MSDTFDLADIAHRARYGLGLLDRSADVAAVEEEARLQREMREIEEAKAHAARQRYIREDLRLHFVKRYMSG